MTAFGAETVPSSTIPGAAIFIVLGVVLLLTSYVEPRCVTTEPLNSSMSQDRGFHLSHAADSRVYADMDRTDQHADLIHRLFTAIERRDRQRFAACLHPNCEFIWPPSLPYGGTVAASAPGPGWLETWAPFQPTEVERALSPQVVAAARDVIVVRWHQRGTNAAGDAIDTPVLSSYTIEDGRLKYAEMFYFDLPAVHLFLDSSARRDR